MRKLNNIKRAFFIGIGGIGMSALARYFNATGIEVAGYDRVSTSLTDQLRRRVFLSNLTRYFSVIPEDFRIPGGTLVVYTPAIPAIHSGMLFFREHQFSVTEAFRSPWTGRRDTKVLAVAGTHGKTTISAMLSHILKHRVSKPVRFWGDQQEYRDQFQFRSGGESLWSKLMNLIVPSLHFILKWLSLLPWMLTISIFTATVKP